MSRYKGYFNGLDGTSYTVVIEPSGSTGEYVEIKLAGDSPFIVNYNENETPFEPIRKSTASINVVNNDYMEDILSPYAFGTKVELLKGTGATQTIEWVGFLTPKLYDQEYDKEWEIITFEAADCISALQYVDYECSGSNKSIVSVSSIIAQVCNACKELVGYYWPRSKKVGNAILYPSMLHISEQNFFSDDTDEPWKLYDVLEELCKYLGVTCMQWGNRMYFIDYQYLKNNERIYVTTFNKNTGYIQGAATYLGNPITISQNTYRGSDNNITFEPVYNKVRVNCNMYDAENFIPNIFDDQYLTNIINSGSFYTNYEVQPETPTNPSYPWGASWFHQKYVDDANDADYRYFHRTYKHKFWDSVYYDPNQGGIPTGIPSADTQNVNMVRNYVGATILDLGCVKKKYMSEYYQYIVPSKLDYERYLCIAQHGWGYRGACSQTPVLKLVSGYHPLAHLSTNSYLIINYSIIFEKYKYRAYINPDWTTDTIKLGGTGNEHKTGGCLYFCLGVGGKWWNGTQWSTNRTYFGIMNERTNDSVGSCNEEKKVLNNVSWDMYVNEEGYKIPLDGVDMSGEIEFIVYLPSIQFVLNGSKEWNGYAWVKDLSIKCVQGGQEVEKKEEDIVYENVIDEDAVNELDEIDLKITTFSDMTKPSYSHMLYGIGESGHTFLETIKEENLSGISQKPEENIIEKYVGQYSTPTKKMGLTLDMSITPFNKMYNVDVDNPNSAYVQLGTEIDYKEALQRITLVEKK